MQFDAKQLCYSWTLSRKEERELAILVRRIETTKTRNIVQRRMKYNKHSTAFKHVFKRMEEENRYRLWEKNSHVLPLLWTFFQIRKKRIEKNGEMKSIILTYLDSSCNHGLQRSFRDWNEDKWKYSKTIDNELWKRITSSLQTPQTFDIDKYVRTILVKKKKKQKQLRSQGPNSLKKALIQRAPKANICIFLWARLIRGRISEWERKHGTENDISVSVSIPCTSR